MKFPNKNKLYFLVIVYILILSVSFFILEAEIRKGIIIGDGAFYISSNKIIASKIMLKYYLVLFFVTVGVIILIHKKSKFLFYFLLLIALFFLYIIFNDLARIMGWL